MPIVIDQFEVVSAPEADAPARPEAGGPPDTPPAARPDPRQLAAALAQLAARSERLRDD